MKYAIGYQLPNENTDICSLAIQKADFVQEVYFPWVNTNSGRSIMNSREGYTDWSAQEQLENDLKTLKKNGIGLDLLLNTNCAGKDAVSITLAHTVESVLDRIEYVAGGVDVVTTASPAVAYMVKKLDPNMEVRASVNMRLGNVKAIEYIAHLFDSFYIQRDYNRDFKVIEDVKKWCDNNGKGLCFLANSGCMSFCSGQTFHDNMVAHESEIENVKNISGFVPQICRQHYKYAKNWGSILKSTWVRPEDIHNYDKYFKIAKLATRMHSNPALVVEAYTTGRYYGNLLDLFEPSNGDLIYPYILNNVNFPEDWFERTTECDKNCHNCGYCDSLVSKLFVKAE